MNKFYYSNSIVMNFFTRQKVIIWILAGLLIITFSAMGSLIYFTWIEKESSVPSVKSTTSSRMIATELDMDQAQNADLRYILNQFRDSSAFLVDAIKQKRLSLMDELRSDAPDTGHIRFLSGEIGNLQSELTNLAATQYLEIRNICDSSQQLKLSDIYCDLFGCPRISYGKRDGLRKNYQYRNRHSQQGQ